jgi:hypothetical protein
MASVAFDGKKSLGNGYVFGAPVKELGFFGCVLISLATGMMGFLTTTLIGIFAMMVAGHRSDLSLSYKWGGVPAGLLVFLVVASYLFTFWSKRVFRKQ